MNLIDLEAFVSVVDHGSVVAAAAGLHLTQSAVTRRIQNLEDVLGMPLLDRKTRPLQPTRAGQETYEFAKPVLSSVNDLKGAWGPRSRVTHQAPAHGIPKGPNSSIRAMVCRAFGAAGKSDSRRCCCVSTRGNCATGPLRVGVPRNGAAHYCCGES